MMFTALFWLSLLTVHNNAEILRLKCGAHANFTTVKSSARLSNAFLTLEGLEATQCQFECTLNEKCKSINVNEDELICELNDKSFEDDKDNATLTSISSWTYYSTSYNETKVGRNCVEKDPCGKGFKCYDSCDCPGYRCLVNYDCTDWYKNGARRSGHYFIIRRDNSAPWPVICDFQSETQSVWTLVMSYALSNVSDFRKPLTKTRNRKENDNPNWLYYRAGKGRMNSVREGSNMWRLTCGFQSYGIDYRDYLRASFTELDVLHFDEAGVCKTVQYINIRGHNAKNIKVAFWQNDQMFHTKSSFNNCTFDATEGSVKSEDNFGQYTNLNTQFRCSESKNATTQLWFGNHV